MKIKPIFRPCLTRDEAAKCAEEYLVLDDRGALEAGIQIRAGDYRTVHLRTIFEWKTGGRGKSRLLRNSDLEVRDAFRLAVSAEAPRSAIAVLTGLDGVAVPVASAIMTVIYPTAYTILDFRALEALGLSTDDRSIWFYLEYLDYCIALAKEWQMDLRQLDRALWQWSKLNNVDRAEPT